MGDFKGGFRVPAAPLVVYYTFQHYMFNMESRHLLNSSVQNALDCISENFNLKKFPEGECARNCLEKCAVIGSPDGRHIASLYYISRPPLSQILRPLLDFVVSSLISNLLFPQLMEFNEWQRNLGLTVHKLLLDLISTVDSAILCEY